MPSGGHLESSEAHPERKVNGCLNDLVVVLGASWVGPRGVSSCSRRTPRGSRTLIEGALGQSDDLGSRQARLLEIRWVDLGASGTLLEPSSWPLGLLFGLSRASRGGFERPERPARSEKARASMTTGFRLVSQSVSFWGAHLESLGAS